MNRDEFEKLVEDATAGMSESQKTVVRRAMQERYAEKVAEHGSDRWGGTSPPEVGNP
jgi:hypothetical protein